jgi:hypothetical protein
VRSARARCAVDAWIGPGWTLLERHERSVAAAPDAALGAMAGLTLRELPAVRALFALRGLRFDAGQTLRGFFSTAPFVVLAEEPGRELVSGVLVAARGAASGRRWTPASSDEFRRALGTAPFAAIATFRAEPRGATTLLWTETWARTRGLARPIFGAYWLVIGPWSAWIRRMFLHAARAKAERAASGARRSR